MERGFSNTHKSTLNLESKLAQDERVLIVDENDEPVRAASRLEMVINSNSNSFLSLEATKPVAQKHIDFRDKCEEGIHCSEEVKAQGLLPRLHRSGSGRRGRY